MANLDPLQELQDTAVLNAFLNPFSNNSSVFTTLHKYDRRVMYDILEEWDQDPSQIRSIFEWHSSSTDHSIIEYIDVLVEAHENGLIYEATGALRYAYDEQNSLTVEQLYQAIELCRESKIPIEWATELVFTKESEEVLRELAQEEEKQRQHMLKVHKRKDALRNLRI